MANSKSPSNPSWFSHETQSSELAGLSSAFAAQQRDRHASGWRRNGLILLAAVVLAAAVKWLMG